MAIEPTRSGPDQAIQDYLELKYPGITHDCTGYQHVSKPHGGDILTVNLMMDRNPRPTQVISRSYVRVTDFLPGVRYVIEP